ncbi:MAG: HAD family phosphatase [Candidatus Anstonellales archaeon]
MKFDAAFFDFDGLLADSERIAFRAWNLVLSEYGHKITKRDYSSLSGLDAITIALNLSSRFCLAEDPAALRDKRDGYARQITAKEGIPLLPYAEHAINEMKRVSSVVGVVSGSVEQRLIEKAGAAGLDGKVDLLIGLKEGKSGKPSPDLYLEALEKTGASPKKSIAFEDTSSGVEAASSAGIRVIAVPTEFSKAQDFSKALAVAKDLKEAIEIAKKL